MPDDIFSAKWLDDRPRVQPEPATTNRFHDAKNVTELMYRVVAATAVACRATPDNLDAIHAVRLADAAIDRLIELAWARQNYVITDGTTTRT